jgi:DNA-binding transcriptional ArsR family regulator
MEMSSQVAAFAALAQEHRLAVFRLLMHAGPTGLSAGEIASALGVPRSTLSSHLAQMERAGLLRSVRRQRHIIYSVHIEGTRRLIQFLTEDCCQGRPELCGFVPAEGCAPAAKPRARATAKP